MPKTWLVRSAVSFLICMMKVLICMMRKQGKESKERSKAEKRKVRGNFLVDDAVGVHGKKKKEKYDTII